MASGQRHRRNPRWRGIGLRLLGISLGVVLGGALIVAQALPTPRVVVAVHVRATLTSVPDARASQPAWPASGGAAVAVQSLDGAGTVVQLGPRQVEAPIASVTKMMTAWVAVNALPPITPTSGPCVTVTAQDVQEYAHDLATDQSHAAVRVGEQICAYDLLAGLLVHSANNYASLLARLTTTTMGATPFDFLAVMNQTAAALGMHHTTYVDYSGFDPGSQSTAADQLLLALRIMRNPLLRHLVSLRSVVVPVAGRVTTYTPLLGTNGVVGIKSGRTGYAGGCDVMALEAMRDHQHFLVYAVITNQYGGDVLANAGQAAYRLAQSVLPSLASYVWSSRVPAGYVTWGNQRIALRVHPQMALRWWGVSPPPVQLVRMRLPATRLHRGQVVAEVRATRTGEVLATVVATTSSREVPWWHRLR